jgi:hypothetical protein
MEEKTSITLSKDILAKVDRIAGSKQSRSAFIERVLRKYSTDRAKAALHARDFERISRAADRLYREAFTNGEGLATRVTVNSEEGLKQASWIMCDNLISLRKSGLTHYVGSLGGAKLVELNSALKLALELWRRVRRRCEIFYFTTCMVVATCGMSMRITVPEPGLLWMSRLKSAP